MQTNNISSTTPIKASEDLVVDVLECETPIISKNQQLREQGKRSSIGLRGKRVSEVLNGTQASPHSDIATNKYYTLIDAGLSDPLRMRQLILWCAMKAIQSNSLVAGNKILPLQNAVLEGLTTKRLNLSWYQRTDDFKAPEFTKAPHPNNVANAQRIDLLKDQLKRFKEEEQEWNSIAEFYRKDHEKHRREDETLTLQYDSVKEILQPEMANFLKDADAVCKSADSLIELVNKNSQFNGHLLEKETYQSGIALDDISLSCETLYSKMIRASLARERVEIKRIDPLKVLGLMGKVRE